MRFQEWQQDGFRGRNRCQPPVGLLHSGRPYDSYDRMSLSSPHPSTEETQSGFQEFLLRGSRGVHPRDRAGLPDQTTLCRIPSLNSGTSRRSYPAALWLWRSLQSSVALPAVAVWRMAADDTRFCSKTADPRTRSAPDSYHKERGPSNQIGSVCFRRTWFLVRPLGRKMW